MSLNFLKLITVCIVMSKKQDACFRGLGLLFVLLPLFYSGCATTHKVDEKRGPLIETAASFSMSVNEAGKAYEKWWMAINDPLLDDYIAEALDDNFTMKVAYARIKQSAATRRQAVAILRPELTGEVSGNSGWDNEGRQTDLLSMDAALSWEVDLWNRLSAVEKAAVLESEATFDDLYDTALLLSSQVADAYFQLVEQRLQMDLISKQVEISETFLKLIKLRFSYGKASMVDVHQQRQQVAELQSQLPIVRSRMNVLNNRLHLLLGNVPTGENILSSPGLPELSPLPKLGIPADLLINRPDLRRLHKQLIIADYSVAQAIAARLPNIRIGAGAGLQGEHLSAESLVLSVFGEAIMPLLDWGRRKEEVNKQRAVVEEEVARYTQAYLTAIEEVENALAQEKGQADLFRALDEQIVIARANLMETRNRYLQGLSDYLPVLAALQSVQRLERDIISQKRELISMRILLYRALGGTDFTTLLMANEPS